ncbi:FHA domain-containing protein [Mastigocoleus testarum]|uniref:FHA domain-containing protein n=1 Tax=Mastigocoleus testarum BC008 TaxID=371196 RepID=A0A0V7ZT67_9CYAN|nr:FHA domain-containing protein [Mastigocoleus testarum]KST64495.1 hypothetical protein BC008_17865 [Mastigocoleus testarum BC008]KST67824.1 hypothetical protein BC008_44585 [Mastigocoleus testarum BC008]
MSNLHLSRVERSPVVAELAQSELQKKLQLYQVFLKLYEHHGALLNQILQLENLTDLSFEQTRQSYVQAVINGKESCIITNLGEGKSRKLRQPQLIWTIGRGENNGICVGNQYISRHHAAIQYLKAKGFILIDFNSTNGSYVNGERIYQSQEIQDGDSIRLGNLIFPFFINLSTQILPIVATELLTQSIPKKNKLNTREPENFSDETKQFPSSLSSSPEILQKLKSSDRHLVGISILEKHLKLHQNSEIVDSFFESK